MRLISTILVLLLSTATFAQSGRVATSDGTVTPPPGRTIKEMYDEASTYVKVKAAEYDAKKIAYSDSLYEQLRKEQRMVAARLATQAEERKDLTTDDRYYLGMLQWIAQNRDRTIEHLQKVYTAAGVDDARAQTSRAIVVVALSQTAKTDSAEELLAEYYAKQPRRSIEIAKIEGELAKAYQSQGAFPKMLPHALANLAAVKALMADQTTAGQGAGLIADAEMLVFEANRDLAQPDKAEAALDDLKMIAAKTASPAAYYFAVDQKIRYLIDTGRKAKALDLYRTSVVDAAADFTNKDKRTDVISRIQARETAYKILGLPAPELPDGMVWFPGTARSVGSLKGKVVLLDFWATWCAPCVEALPEIVEWHEQFGDKGLEILGLTRYYGKEYGTAPDNATEIAQLKVFREKHNLPYDIVVSDGQAAQILYGGMTLPTAVLIDRKGIVRYVATGTSSTRTAEIRSMIEKLIAEK